VKIFVNNAVRSSNKLREVGYYTMRYKLHWHVLIKWISTPNSALFKSYPQ